MSKKEAKKASQKNKGISHSLAGRLLVAMPSLSDPRFHKAVIFMCAHDAKGAMGFMVNHPMPEVSIENIIDQTGIESELIIDVPPLDILRGGPVEKARGFLLHSPDFKQKDTIEISDDFSVTGTLNALEDIIGGKGPENMLFVLGHAGWSAGQLDQELQQNAWLIADATPDIVFHNDVDAKWTLALNSIGVDPGMLSAQMGMA